MYNSSLGVPELTEDEIADINSLFTPYLFFSKSDNVVTYECSVCRKQYSCGIERIMTAADYEALKPEHNTTARCRECGTIATLKNTARLHGCATLCENRRVSVFTPADDGKTVWIRSYFCWKDYSNQVLRPTVTLRPNKLYRLTDGSAKSWEYQYDNWVQLNSIGAPFVAWKWIWGAHLIPECVIGLERTLEATWLKYSCVADWDYYQSNQYKLDTVLYLANYARYPAIEIAMRLGNIEAVNNLISGRPQKRVFDWRARTPYQWVKLAKSDYKELYRSGLCHQDVLPDILRIRKATTRSISFAQAAEIAEGLGKYGYVQEFLKHAKKYGDNPRHIWKYLQTQNEKNPSQTYQEWRDYINCATSAGYDTGNVLIRYPRDLQKKHKEASKAMVLLKQKNALTEEINRHAALAKHMEISIGGYSFVAPLGAADIIAEGKALKHCVGSYAERHVKGQTTIMFLRSTSIPDEPLYTIEVWKHADKWYLRQAHGYDDGRTNPEKEPLNIPYVKEIIDKWLNYISLPEPKRMKWVASQAVTAAS